MCACMCLLVCASGFATGLCELIFVRIEKCRVCVCMCVCMCACMCVCKCVNLRVFVFVCLLVCVLVCVRMYVFVHACLLVCTSGFARGLSVDSAAGAVYRINSLIHTGP